MLGEGGTPLEEFEAAARKFVARGEQSVDLKRYRAVIDGLDGDFSTTAAGTVSPSHANGALEVCQARSLVHVGVQRI